MNNASGQGGCTRRCWIGAALAGIVVMVLLMASAGWGFFLSLVVGLLVFVLTGLVLSRLLCAEASANISAPPVRAGTGDPAPAPAAPESAAEPPAAEAPAAPASGEPRVKPSAVLPGQQELAGRKGAWKYRGADAPRAPAVPAAEQPADAAPAGLTAPRTGGADDLKLIKGVGPKLEKLLNSMGYYHFDQIAGWSAEDIAWVDDNLEGFRGRVSRDGWVEQARKLAAGEETEFARRAKSDGLYD